MRRAWTVIWRTIVALPLLVFGLGALVSALSDFARYGMGLVAFGVLFTFAGVFLIWSGVRAVRSAEAEGMRVPVPLAGAPDAPAAGAGYREHADSTGQAASAIYGAQLAYLPVQKLRARPGRQGRVALGARDKRNAWIVVFAAIVWNVVMWPIFVAGVLDRSWSALLFFLLSALGVFLFVASSKRLLALQRLVIVELDAEPLFLGDTSHVTIEQRGAVHFRRIKAALVCQERAMKRVGKHTRRDEHEVSRADLLEEENVRIASGERWTRRLPLQLPAGPPSFAAPSNEVAWAIVVKAEIENWPDYEESFVFRALPKVAR